MVTMTVRIQVKAIPASPTRQRGGERNEEGSARREEEVKVARKLAKASEYVLKSREDGHEAVRTQERGSEGPRRAPRLGVREDSLSSNLTDDTSLSNKNSHEVTESRDGNHSGQDTGSSAVAEDLRKEQGGGERSRVTNLVQWHGGVIRH